MRARLAQELELLRQYFPGVQHIEQDGIDWFLVPDYRFPPGWRISDKDINSAPIAFKLVATYPEGEPYGFAAPAGINFKGTPPANPGSAVTPPFAGSWQHFSWAPDGWLPSNNPREGSNLVVWVRSFARRLEEGV
jgi:hypothetical protein